MVEKKYTLGFVRLGNEILLLNKEKGWWMGTWNGVGGKVEKGETPSQGMIREIFEETGIRITEADLEFGGVVTWEAPGDLGGMYIYIANIKPEQRIQTPTRINYEGVLDWKPIEWILSKKNMGIPTNIPYFLPSMIEKKTRSYHCVYNDKGVMEKFIYDLEL